MAVATTSSSDNIAPPSQSMDKSPTTNLTDAAAVTESLSAVNGSSSASPADLADNSKSSYSPSRQLEFQVRLSFVVKFGFEIEDQVDYLTDCDFFFIS